MRRHSILILILLTLCCGIQARELAKMNAYKKGTSALRDHLPELAITQFNKLLNDPSLKLSDKDRSTLLLLLCESQVKATQPDAALATLKHPLLLKHPDSSFWKGLTLAISGRYQLAIDTLTEVKANNPHHLQATITRANLYLALGNDPAAVLLLKQLAAQKKSAISNKATIKLAELYLRQNQDDMAAKVIASIKSPSPDSSIAKLKQLLSARLHSKQQDYPKAIAELTELLKSPVGLNARASVHAALALADARHHNAQPDEALQGLFDYITKHPNTPLLEKLFQRIANWIPESPKDAAPYILHLQKLAKRLTTAPSPAPATAENADLLAFAHYYYALSLSKNNSPIILQKALFEFSLLRLNHPTHILAGSSLTETARIQLQLKKNDEAIRTLKLIQSLNITISPIAKQQAAFLLGELYIKKADYKKAAASFLIARNGNLKTLRSAATINAGLAFLSQDEETQFSKLFQSLKRKNLTANLAIEQALWKARNKDTEARPLLKRFIIDHPAHQRTTEARLALALHAISVAPSDIQLCQETLAQLSQAKLTTLEYEKLSFIRYQNAISHSDYLGAIATADSYLSSYPSGDRVLDFTLLKGQALYRNGEHNKARRILTKLVLENPESPLSPYALYYSAISARLEGTPQSQLEALTLLQQTIDTKSAISNEASIQKADLLTQLNQPEKAYQLLKKIYQPTQTTAIQRDIAISLAASLYTMGSQDNKHHREALEIYQNLLKFPNLPLPWKHRTLYRIALSYQAMNQDQNALSYYYQVINTDTSATPITQWQWYYKSGFNAIAMLTELQKPKAAIVIAKKLAASNGPRAQDAAHRARDLEMKFMIWTE